MSALFALALVLVGCSEETGKFPVVITALSDDGKPFADLPVMVGTKTIAGKTDAEGHLKMRINGKEGQKIAVSITVPEGYKLAGSGAPLVLRRLADIEGGSGRTLPIEHVIKLSPHQRQYAVLVRVGVAGLPVEAFGSVRAVTNAKGVAMFMYAGAPGDELQVKLSTTARPELRPQNPTVSFLLAQRSEAYVVKQAFGVYRAPVARQKRPKHIGPKRL